MNAQNYSKGNEYQNNCQRCVWAYELQRRGYDVEALPSPPGDTLGNGMKWTKIAQGEVKKIRLHPDGYVLGSRLSRNDEIKIATNIMSKWGEGSRGIISVVWSRQRYGHVFNVEYKNGKITAYDAQTGKITSLSSAMNGARIGFSSIYRTDDVIFDNSKTSQYVKKRGK